MTKKAGPEGAPWMIPYLTVLDVDKAVAFYENTFGFVCKGRTPGEDGSNVHAEMLYKGQLLMLGKAGAYNSHSESPVMSGVDSPMNLYLYCENVDGVYKHAVKVGAKSVTEPKDMFWGDRMCRLKDPDGYVWGFATFLKEKK